LQFRRVRFTGPRRDTQPLKHARFAHFDFKGLEPIGDAVNRAIDQHPLSHGCDDLLGFFRALEVRRQGLLRVSLGGGLWRLCLWGRLGRCGGSGLGQREADASPHGQQRRRNH
jgi:hypothetical protein